MNARRTGHGSSRRYGPLIVATSRESKLLFPEDGIAKRDLIEYYEKISPHLIPHLEDRPLVMQRFPDGIDGEGFFHNQVPDYFPDWVHRVRVTKEGGTQDLVVCGNTATLAYLADQACITFHPWLSRVDDLTHPDLLILDLDPPGESFGSVRRTALACRDLLDELGLPSFVKTTGSQGLHVAVPLDRSVEFEAVRGFARSVARVLVARDPDRLTVEARKEKRGDRIYVDVGRNAYAQTAVAPYTVRALPGAPVAAPLLWSEVESGKVDSGRAITMKSVFRRLARIEDPWTGMRRRRVSLAGAIERLPELMR